MKRVPRHTPLILLLLVVLLSGVFPQTLMATDNIGEAVSLRTANMAYSNGKYQEAIEQYEKLLSRDGLSAFVLYNLANSYAQAGNTGKAILNYERAQLLSNGDSDIQGNLALIRKNEGLFQEELPFDKKLQQVLSINQWALFALVSLLLLTAQQVASLFLPIGKGAKIWAGGVFLLLFSISIGAIFLQYGTWHSAVVVQPDIRLLLSPFPSASSIGIIQEGRLVIPEKKHAGYYLVKEEAGRTGWVPESAIEFIAEPPNHLK
jgi:tetratricopeptide (TPR) repeat protein